MKTYYLVTTQNRIDEEYREYTFDTYSEYLDWGNQLYDVDEIISVERIEA